MTDMDDVDRAFGDYVLGHREGGRADAAGYLARLTGDRRRELAELIDGYLARQPRRPFDPEAFARSRAAKIADSLHRALHGRAGMWPVVLPRLRERAGLSEEDLVPRLASALGAPNEQSKVGRYYREMEHGVLSAGGVSNRVLNALGDIVDSAPHALREVGMAIEAPEPPATAPGSTWDQIDELFQGGG